MRLTITNLLQMTHENNKIAMLTCYDASFAQLLEANGVEILLVGDSLGMVIQGHDTTLPVQLSDIEYHTRCVARHTKRPFIIADMPFGSYQESPEQAYRHASQLLAAGAQMVKLEGGHWLLPTIHFLSERDIPVCGHLGLTPQSVYALSGYRVQGKTDAEAEQIHTEAKALEAAGARLLVLESVPATLATKVTENLRIPTIGIGAGPNCSGQVLVLYDLLGIYPGKPARFVKNFLQQGGSIAGAIAAYIKAVKEKTFPGPEHCF